MRLRREVRRFADMMEAKLRENDHKGGWTNEDASWLLERLRQETNELSKCALCHGVQRDSSLRERVGLEAADVANFAMMVADVCGALR